MCGGWGGHQAALGGASLRLGFNSPLLWLTHTHLAKITMCVIWIEPKRCKVYFQVRHLKRKEKNLKSPP
jgi:hypothetical protein